MFRFPGWVRVKAGAATLRTRAVVAVRLPEAPVMVSALAPTVALLLAVRVSVLLFVVGLGEKAAVTPWGKLIRQDSRCR